MFYLADCLRGLNVNPTLKMIQKLGGAAKKGEKFMKLEEFYPIYGMYAIKKIIIKQILISCYLKLKWKNQKIWVRLKIS